jgi:aminopeptidase N
MDALATAAAPLATIRREDYRPPDWLVPEVALDFRLDPEETLVTARLTVRRNGAHAQPLRLNGEGLHPSSVTIDGATLQDAWRMDGADLVVGRRPSP